MYLNKNRHSLSTVLLLSALIHVATIVILVAVRMVIRSAGSNSPDMIDQRIRVAQYILSLVQMIAITVLFIVKLKPLWHELDVVDEDDALQMAALQQEVFGRDLPSLSGINIEALMELWGGILVGVRLVYEITALLYQRFIVRLMGLTEGGNETVSRSFVSLYNETHGFKYVGLFIAIMLGVMMTGILLDDRLLKCVAGGLMALFLIFFALMEMGTVTILGYRIGVVWTSMIIHLTETVGLMLLSIYLRKYYKGI